MLSILLWNVQNSKENLQVLLETAGCDILAIQEPWMNQGAGRGAYCYRSSRYHLVHRPGSRAAIYVTKNLEIREWDYQIGQDWCSITLRGSNVTIWSVYTPPSTNDTIPPPFSAIQPHLLTGQNILAGNFNSHHPLWEIGRAHV